MPANFLKTIAIFATLAFACAAFGADEAAPVQKPEVKVGDRWTYRTTDHRSNVPQVRRYEERVAFVGPDDILTVGTNDKESVWTSEWAAISFGGSGVSHDKPRRLLSFPLKVGTSHQIAYEVVARRGSVVRSRFEDTVKVVGWEDVVVPAGTFRALKIETTGTFQRLDVRLGGWTRREIWYSPEARRWVKWTYEDGTGARSSPYTRNMEELVEFHVQ